MNAFYKSTLKAIPAAVILTYNIKTIILQQEVVIYLDDLYFMFSLIDYFNCENSYSITLAGVFGWHATKDGTISI